MGIRSAALVGLAGLLGMLAPARAGTGVVIGDSLGVGLAEVSHLENFAHDSVHIRGPKALDQIRRAPAGATAFDGVHLKIKGYAYMWDKARRAADLGAPAAIAAAADAPATQPASAAPGARFELAAASGGDLGGPPVDEPKIYLLRVKRNHVTAQAN